MKAVFPKVVLVCFSLALAGCGGHALNIDDPIYAAVGASDAVGIGAVPLRRGYVFRIRDALEARGKDVALVNLGIPGANTDTINRRVERFLRMDVNPHLVTVWVGANDIIDGVEVDAFEGELRKLLTLLKERSDGPIFIANIPDLTQLPRFRGNPNRRVTLRRVLAFNTVIADQAEAFNITLVNLFNEQFEDKCVSDIDGFHPNNGGHQRIAGKFLDAITHELTAGLAGAQIARR